MDAKQIEQSLKDALRDALNIAENLAANIAANYAARLIALKTAQLGGDADAGDKFDTVYANIRAEAGIAEIVTEAKIEAALLATLKTALAFINP